MERSLAARIRDCVDILRTDPDPDQRALDELLRVAVQVQRQEAVLDEQVSDARAALPMTPRFRWSVAR